MTRPLDSELSSDVAELVRGCNHLVLTNAIYFLGCWKSEFDVDNTVDAPFWTEPERSVSVPMMKQTEFFRYCEFDGIQVLEMPYRSETVEWKAVKHGDIEGMEAVEVPGSGSDFVMCIMLPRQIDGLEKLEDELSVSNLRKWTTLRTCEVNASIPRFRVEASFQLDDALRSLGMEQGFSPTDANFSKMSDDPEGLYISAVLHKAFVDVNEKGTEAAAATGVAMGGRGAMPEPPRDFRADHPFLFLIRDRRTRLIHFMGRMRCPTDKG